MPLPITPATAAFITLDEVKDQANITRTVTKHDDELTRFAGAAQEAVEHLIGPVRHRTVTQTVRSHGGRAVLREVPVLQVQAATAYGAVTSFTLDAATGVLSGLPHGADVTVTYTVGREVATDSMITAALIIAEHLWKTQRASSPSPMQAEDDGAVPVPGLGYAIPYRAVDLLRPYLLGPAVA